MKGLTVADHQRRNPDGSSEQGWRDSASASRGAHGRAPSPQGREGSTFRQAGGSAQRGRHAGASAEQRFAQSRVAGQRSVQPDPARQRAAGQQPARSAQRQSAQPAQQRVAGRAAQPAQQRAARQTAMPAARQVGGSAAVPHASASAQAYRRSNDGSGYRPVQPAGKGGKKGGPWRVVFWIALVVLVASLAVLGALVFSYWQGQNSYDKIADQAFEAPDDVQGTALEDLQVDWDALRAINPDIVGWIYIPDTVVNYPIVQGEDDEHYLYYDFNGERGWGATFGTIFLQAANKGDFSDANNVIYGHNLNSGDMFSCFGSFTDPAQFNAHRDVYLLTPQGNYKLRTFSLVHCAPDDPLAQVSFADDAEQAAYVQDKMDRSVSAPEGELPAAEDIDRTFAFVTCDNLPSDGRYVLFAYIDDTTVAGEHAAGGGNKADEGAAQDAVSEASEELAAA